MGASCVELINLSLSSESDGRTRSLGQRTLQLQAAVCLSPQTLATWCIHDLCVDEIEHQN